MNAREVIEKYRQEVYGDYSLEPDGTGLIARLKAEGLFVGPLRSTVDMDLASPLDPQSSTDAWDAMVEEWQRTEGA